MKKLFFLLIPFFGFSQTVPITATRVNPITFTVTNNRWVSIGIYNGASQLVRTVQSNVYYAKGKHTIYWDAKDDNGNLLTGTYKYKVLSDSALIRPNGGVGNTSDSSSGSTVLHAYSPPADIVQVSHWLYVAIGKNEANQSIIKIDTAHPNQKTNIPYNGIITGQIINHLATDGTLVYIAATGYQLTDNFVYAIKTSNDAENVFSSGAPYTSYAIRNYASVFDKNLSGATGNVTGLAVQQAGVYLFVAHSGQNVINVYNKTTGAFVRADAITAPGKIHLETDGLLWTGLGTTAVKYTVNSDGTLTSLLTISGFQRVAAISHKGANVYIEDGGTNQQIHIYNSTSGASVGTLLQSGGYSATSVVANDRVYIQDLHGALASFITFLSDGTMWTGDPGNYRVLHFNSLGTYQNQIQYLGVSYSANAIGTRIFSGFLEFAVDYSTGAWSQTNNYGYAFPATINGQSVATTYMPFQVFTLSNGGTYSIFKNNGGQLFFGELTTAGFVPFSTVLPSGLTWNPDGTFSAATLAGTIQTFKNYAQTGYSGRRPVISTTGTTLVSYDIGTQYPRAGSSPSNNPSYLKTSTNRLIVFSPNYIAGPGSGSAPYRLAAYDLSRSQWAWKSAPITWSGYTGIMPSNEKFDIGNTSHNQGGSVWVNGNILGYGYHGEGWKAGQTNILNFFDESGLMIAQGGTTLAQSVGEAPLGLTGNTFNFNLVSAGGNLHVWENDESRHSMVMHYVVSGLATIHIDSGIIVISNRSYTIPRGNRVDLLAGNAENVPLVRGANGWTGVPVIDNANFTTLVRRNQADLNKSPDVFVKANNNSPVILNQNISRTLPSVTATNWEVTGAIDLGTSPFQGDLGSPTAPTGTHFYVAVSDLNHKVIGVFSFEALSITLRFNNVVVKSGFPASMVYNPMKFAIKRVGSGVYMTCVINGVTYTSSLAKYDPTADISRPRYFSVNFQFTNQQKGAGFDLSDLFFNWQ